MCLCFYVCRLLLFCCAHQLWCVGHGLFFRYYAIVGWWFCCGAKFCSSCEFVLPVVRFLAIVLHVHPGGPLFARWFSGVRPGFWCFFCARCFCSDVPIRSGVWGLRCVSGTILLMFSGCVVGAMLWFDVYAAVQLQLSCHQGVLGYWLAIFVIRCQCAYCSSGDLLLVCILR